MFSHFTFFSAKSPFATFQKMPFEYNFVFFKKMEELTTLWNDWWIILEFSEFKLVGQFV